MDNSMLEALGVAVALIIGAIGKHIHSVYKTKQEANQKEKDTETEQAFDLYKSMVQDLQKECRENRNRITEIERDHAKSMALLMLEHTKCREDNARLLAEVKVLQKQVEILSKQLSTFVNKKPEEVIPIV